MLSRAGKRRQLEQRIKEIQKELATIKGFRQSRQRDQFIRQLVGEHAYLKRQLSTLRPSSQRETKRERQRRLSNANKQRSVKMKRSWGYFHAIQQNHRPDLSLRQIRSLFKKQKEGLETEVSKVVWANPSP